MSIVHVVIGRAVYLPHQEVGAVDIPCLLVTVFIYFQDYLVRFVEVIDLFPASVLLYNFLTYPVTFRIIDIVYGGSIPSDALGQLVTNMYIC
jgi:hypothetical protein